MIVQFVAIIKSSKVVSLSEPGAGKLLDAGSGLTEGGSQLTGCKAVYLIEN